MQPPSEGETRTVERTFTVADVREFAELSRDTQPRHTEPDEDGRVMVQGLLTATLPTKIGSDYELLAREMDFEFVRPVYTGETVACAVTIERVEERADRYDVTAAVECDAAGETALTGSIEGLVWKRGDDAERP